MTLREWFRQQGYGASTDSLTNTLTITRGFKKLQFSLEALVCIDGRGLDAPVESVSDVLAVLQEQLEVPAQAYNSLEEAFRHRDA
jgi:hypothetical protein